MSKKDVHIALLMMVKNEKKRLSVSLQSVLGVVDSIVLYDTGSTDNTIEIAEKFCKSHNIPLRLKQGEFVNFSESRNVSLDFADTFEDIDYILLLDTNDELRNGDKLRKFVSEFHVKNEPNKSTGFLLCQEWWSGQYDKYYNMRMVQARKGWRYKGSVHEYMTDTTRYEEEAPQVYRVQDDIVLYQDRTQDDDKSGKRFSRDKIMLLKDYEKDPKEPRTLFYLAQTCSCLNQLDESLRYYLERTQVDGFIEEKFHAYLRSGDLSHQLNKPWEETMGYYLKSFKILQRVEPLMKIAEYYKFHNQWLLSYMFINLGCQLPFPHRSILFIDKNAYDYSRWHILGIVGWYSGHFEDGKMAAIIAINSGKKNPEDVKNLKFYEDREKKLNINKPYKEQYSVIQRNIDNIDSIHREVENQTHNDKIVTKAEFMKYTVDQLTNTNPGLSMNQMISRSNLLWKKREKKKV